MHTTCDLSGWPIVTFQMGADNHTGAQSTVVIKGLKDALARQSPFATVTDLTQMPSDTKSGTDAYKEFINTHRDALRRFCKGGALIVNSHAMRLVVNAFVLVARMPFPVRAFMSRSEALAWCTDQVNAKAA